MHKDIKLSIIVIVYNIELTYLEKCILSLNQRVNDDYKFEIIIVDDGSTESVSRKCDLLAKDYNFMYVIHQKNGGSSSARNTGINKAQGKWITFIDGDDWVADNYINVIMEHLDNELDILWFNHNDIKDNIYINQCIGYDLYIEQLELEQCHLAVLQEQHCIEKYPMFFGAVWQAAYKKSFLNINNIRFIEGLIRAQDAVFNMYVLQFAKKIKYIDCALYNYRIYSGSVCHKYNNKTKAYQKLFVELKKFIDIYEKNEMFYSAYKVLGFQYFLELLRLNYFHKECPLSWSETYNELTMLISEPPFKDIIFKLDCNKLTLKRNFVLQLIKMKQFKTLKILSRFSERFLL